jgi:hypothetical protein
MQTVAAVLMIWATCLLCVILGVVRLNDEGSRGNGDPGEVLVVVWMVVGETKAQTRWWRADEGDGGAIAGSAPVRKWRRRGLG